jgi:hypothetical protein
MFPGISRAAPMAFRADGESKKCCQLGTARERLLPCPTDVWMIGWMRGAPPQARARALRTIVPWLGAAFGLWCGCQEPAPSDPVALTERDELAADLAVTICESAGPCCAGMGLGEPGESCRTKMRNAVMLAIILAEDEQRELRPGQSAFCVATYRDMAAQSADCKALPTPSALTTLCPDLFTPIPEGALAPGEPCHGTFECASPADETSARVCVKIPGATVGTCTWFVPVEEGAVCAHELGLERVCPEGLKCAPRADEAPVGSGSVARTETMRCGVAAGLEEPCVYPDSCGEGLVCTAYAAEVPICVASLLPGDDCFQMPDACARGSLCDVVTSKCASFPEPCAEEGCSELIMEHVCK